MKKRLYNRIFHEFENSLTDAVRIYLTVPRDNDFQDISIDFIKINAFMLLSFHLDKGIIKIGKENRIKEITLKKINMKLIEL